MRSTKARPGRHAPRGAPGAQALSVPPAHQLVDTFARYPDKQHDGEVQRHGERSAARMALCRWPLVSLGARLCGVLGHLAFVVVDGKRRGQGKATAEASRPTAGGRWARAACRGCGDTGQLAAALLSRTHPPTIHTVRTLVASTVKRHGLLFTVNGDRNAHCAI